MSHPTNDKIVDHQRDNLNEFGIDQREVYQNALNKWHETAKSFIKLADDRGQESLAKLRMACEDVEEEIHHVNKSAKEYEDARLEGEQLSNMIHSERVSGGSDWS
jgi:hypothetical protein